MNNALQAHKLYMTEQIKNAHSPEEQQALYRYHLDRVHDFQHERLIHLLVTFFFAMLALAALGAWIFTPVGVISIPLGLLALLLCILEIAYIIHYYKLENGVQSLYPITETLNGKSA